MSIKISHLNGLLVPKIKTATDTCKKTLANRSDDFGADKLGHSPTGSDFSRALHIQRLSSQRFAFDISSTDPHEAKKPWWSEEIMDFLPPLPPSSEDQQNPALEKALFAKLKSLAQDKHYLTVALNLR